MADVKFTRGAEVKITQERFTPQLISLGWVRADGVKQVEQEKSEETENPEMTKADLLERAKALGLDVDGRTSEKKLRELIEEEMAD